MASRCSGWGAADEPVALPAGWEAGEDPQSGKSYYYNTATGETSWRPPLTSASAARPARATPATTGPRDAQREGAKARREQRGAKQRELDAKQSADLLRMKRRAGARVDDGDDEAAVSNTGSRRDAPKTKQVALKSSPRPRPGSAATAIQAQARGRQARSRSPSPQRGTSAVAIASEPAGPRDEDALARGMHAASDFISCLQSNLTLPAPPLAAFKFQFDGDKALAGLAAQAKAEALSGEQRRAARLAVAEATMPAGLGLLDRKLWGAFCVADLDGSGTISRSELGYAFR